MLPPPPEGYHRKRRRENDTSPGSPLAATEDPSSTSSSSSDTGSSSATSSGSSSSSSSDASSSANSGPGAAEIAAKELHLSRLQEQFMCGICDEIMVDAWSFGCSGGHANCKACVLPWVKEHATCPQCQSKVSLPGNRVVPVDQIIEASVVAELVDSEEASRYWSRRGIPAPTPASRKSSSSSAPSGPSETPGATPSAEPRLSTPAPSFPSSQPAVAPIFHSRRNRSRGNGAGHESTASKVIDVDNDSSPNDAEVRKPILPLRSALHSMISLTHFLWLFISQVIVLC